MNKLKFEMDMLDVLRRHELIGDEKPRHIEINLYNAIPPNVEIDY